MDEIWKRDEIDSPCVKICVIHPEAKICIGCHRTIDEISNWSKLENTDRQRIKEELPGRAPKLRGSRRGRRRG